MTEQTAEEMVAKIGRQFGIRQTLFDTTVEDVLDIIKQAGYKSPEECQDKIDEILLLLEDLLEVSKADEDPRAIPVKLECILQALRQRSK